jgi:hypothetical protein
MSPRIFFGSSTPKLIWESNSQVLAILAILTLSILLFFPRHFAHASVTLGTPNTSALSQGLVGYWPLDGATTNWKTGITSDLSGQGNNGALVSLSTTTSPALGKIGQALQFKSANTQYVNVPTATALNPIAPNFTLSAWVKKSTSSGTGPIVNKGSTLALAIGVTPCTGSQIKVTKYAVVDICIGAFPSDTNYHDVTAVWSSTGVFVYIDGVLNGSSANTANFSSGGQPLTIGYDSSDSVYFNGTIDDVRAFNRSLSAQEAALLYASGQAHVDQSNTVGLAQGLVGYWTMDGQDIGTSFVDRSGNGFKGYLVGTNNATSSRKTVGKIGEAFTFGGQNTGGIDVGNNVALTPSRFTIAAWIYTPTPNYTYNYIFSNSRDCCSTYNGIGLNINSAGGLTGALWNSTQYNVNSAAGTIATSTWTHAAFTYDGSFMRLYKNGVQVAFSAQTINPGTPASFNSYIGSMGNANGTVFTFNGKMDDVRVYNRALSATEIAQLAAQGSANVAHSNTTSGTGLSSGLVGYWTFDGPNMNWKTGLALDSSGQGNNGALVSMSTTTSPAIGKLGQALNFNGTNSYINIPRTAVLEPSSAVTVSAWIKPSVAGASQALDGKILEKANRPSAPFVSYDLTINSAGSGKLSFELSTGGSLTVLQSNTIPSANKWYHLVGVYDGTNMYTYIDGVQQTSIAKSGSITYASQNLYIGSTGGTPSSFFNGTIDDARIYNRALSTQEVQQLYLTGK